MTIKQELGLDSQTRDELIRFLRSDLTEEQITHRLVNGLISEEQADAYRKQGAEALRVGRIEFKSAGATRKR